MQDLQESFLEMSGTCSSVGTSTLPKLTGVAALAFLVLGSVFTAPYWLYDGTSFALTCALTTLAVRRWRGGAKKAGGNRPHVVFCRGACIVAVVSFTVAVAFLVTAVVLWNDEMNPVARGSYARDGSSFFFCSLFSASTNAWVAIHFWRFSTSDAPAGVDVPSVDLQPV